MTRVLFVVIAALTISWSAVAQWTKCGSLHGAVRTIADSDSVLYVAAGGVYTSTDVGITWQGENIGLSNPDVQALAFLGSSIFVGTSGSGVFRSTTGGARWECVDSGMAFSGTLGGLYVCALVVKDSTIFAGTFGGVLRSTDNGASWFPVNEGLSYWEVPALVRDDANLYASKYARGVYRSTDNGSSWSAANAGLTNDSVYCLATSGKLLYAGTKSGGVFLSTDCGDRWKAVNAGLTDLRVLTLSVVGGAVLAGTWAGVFLSADSGASWHFFNDGLTSHYVASFGAIGEYLFVGTGFSDIWRRPLAELLLSVDSPPSATSVAFALEQNFPNPFNPTTGIRVQLSGDREIRLIVYDILGREVAVLADGRYVAGVHTFTFDGSNLPSGVYFCRLTSGKDTAVRTMVLVR